MYNRILSEQRMAPSPGEKFPEMSADKIWEGIIKKLLLKDYQFDAEFFGSLNQYSRKVAYFFHASLQGTACYPAAAAALTLVREKGLRQGLLADAQSFTLVQLQRGLSKENSMINLDDLFDPDLRVLSSDYGARKPSERLYWHFLEKLKNEGITPKQVLHIGTRMDLDVIPARKLGMRTGLFAGDKGSLVATPEQLKDRALRPDVLLTELSQIGKIIGA